jgi:tRNA A-37 threonylcarbamoyl transferase component Bud32
MTAPASTASLALPLTPLSGVEEQLFNELTAALAPRIQVVSLLGRGGMALVFLGRDPLLKRSIAIKVLSPQFAGSDVARTRFTREAQAAATMTHPNVAAVYDVGELPTGTPYFLMQFLDGKSLAEVITSEGMFAEARARRVIGEVASALAMAHQHGLVHRDVKPANVIIETDSQKAVVVDFGISSATNKEQFTDGGGTLTAIGTYVGTPRYTSPEQAASEPVSGKTDVYSLGVVAFEMLTGKVPFEATNPMALLAAHIKDVPSPIKTLRPDVDAGFAAMIDRCLLKDPAARPDAGEIASFLLPEPQAAMEWPPPGLDELRGQGARAAVSFNWFGTFAAAFILALATQPTRGTAQFTDYEGSLLWSMVANMWAETGMMWTPNATPVWLFVLLLAFAGAGVAFVLYVVRTARLFASVRHGKRQGYSFQVLAAVAADGHADTSDLLNRRGHYAVLTPAKQERLVQARRLSCIVLPGGFLLSGVLLLNWFSGLWSGPDSRPLFEPGQAMLMLLPAAIGLVLTAYLFSLDLPFRSGSIWTGRTRVTARAEFVRDWLNRLKNPQQLRFAPAALVIPAVGVITGTALLFALGVAGVAITIATRNVSRAAGSQPSRFQDPNAWEGWNWDDRRFIADLERLLNILQGPTKVGSAPPNDSASQLFAIETFALTAHAAEHPSTGPDSVARVRNAADAKKALAMLGAGDMDVESHANNHASRRAIARLRLFAQTGLPEQATVATVAMFPPYGYPSEELLQEYAEGRMHLSWFAIPGQDATLRECEALIKAQRVGECRAIAHDMLRAANRLVRSPLTMDFNRGVLLAGAADTLLIRIARGTNDAALLAAATPFYQKAQAMHRRHWSDEAVRHFGLMWAHSGSLLDNSIALSIAGDPRTMPYLRWLIAQNFTTAFCTNPRELLFGVSPVRHEYIRVAMRGGGPRSNQWVRIQHSILDRWIEDPDQEFAERMPDAAAEASVLDPVKWVGMRRLHARLRFCASRYAIPD